AAILRARLPFLGEWTRRRRELAGLYRSALAGSTANWWPECDPGQVYHLFAVRHQRRNALQEYLAQQGIETLVHYPIPIPQQPAFRSLRSPSCPAATRACEELVSLPLHPAM